MNPALEESIENELVKITTDLIEKGRSSVDGWTRDQLALLGISLSDVIDDKIPVKDLEIFLAHMDRARIYSIGSCKPGGEGSYEVVLERDGELQYFTKSLEDTTAHRCIITGMIDAAKLLERAYFVELISSTHIGVQKARRNKGCNVELLKNLFRELQAKGCAYAFPALKGEGTRLNAAIRACAARQDGARAIRRRQTKLTQNLHKHPSMEAS